jgi:hypothetical protein
MQVRMLEGPRVPVCAMHWLGDSPRGTLLLQASTIFNTTSSMYS